MARLRARFKSGYSEVRLQSTVQSIGYLVNDRFSRFDPLSYHNDVRRWACDVVAVSARM